MEILAIIIFFGLPVWLFIFAWVMTTIFNTKLSGAKNIKKNKQVSPPVDKPVVNPPTEKDTDWS
jgi:hypothetical protein